MKRLSATIILFFTFQIAYAQTAGWQTNPQIKQLTAQAVQLENNGEYVKAANAFLAIFGLDQTNFEAANSMADNLSKLGDFRTQLIWAQKALTLKPDFAAAYINLGNSYAGQKNFPLAQQAFQKAASLDPKSPYPVYSLGLIQQTQGNINQALTYYEQSQKIDSNYYDAFYNMALCYDKLKDYNQAYKYIDHYREINDNKEVMYLWAHIKKEIAAQPFTYPVLATSGKTPDDFVPAGWKIKGKTIGDLNGDNIADAALVLEYQTITAEIRANDDTIYSYPRVLLVLLKNGDHYNTIVQQNTFMLRAEEGDHMSGDPYDAIQITKGILNINYEYTRSHLYYKFRYQDRDLFLIGATNAGVSSNILFDWDFNFSTRTLVHDEGESTDENDKTAKNKREVKKLTFPKLKKLSELTEPFTWEPVKDIFI